MVQPAAPVPIDCSLLPAARRTGVALAGVAVVALEVWLRAPVQPLFEGHVQRLQARVAAFFRQLSP